MGGSGLGLNQCQVFVLTVLNLWILLCTRVLLRVFYFSTSGACLICTKISQRSLIFACLLFPVLG